MRAIKLLALSLCLTLGTVQKSNAAVSAVMAIGGAPAAGAVAMTGLRFIGGGFVLSALAAIESCGGGACLGALAYGGIIGLVLLDEGTDSFTFNELKESGAKKLKISEDEMEIYNSEIDEINLIFEEVTANLNIDSSIEESKQAWSEVKEFVSPESFKVMQVLASQIK